MDLVGRHHEVFEDRVSVRPGPRRELNDLRELVASGGASNQSKGGSDAAHWQPVRAAQCGYAVRYVTVKAAYALPTDAAEKVALAAMLATCP